MIDVRRGRHALDARAALLRYWVVLSSFVARVDWLAAALIFAVALLTRLLRPDVPLDIDEDLWMRRGASFIAALLQGDFAGTYQRHHPGVTNMWVIGSALSLRYLVRGWLPLDDLARTATSLSGYLIAVRDAGAFPAGLYTWVRLPYAVLTSACLPAVYALGRRLFGKPVALMASIILLMEPFFLAYQRSLTTDANETNFTWVALLAFLVFCRQPAAERGRWRWIWLSGASFGLALLSKLSAALSLPVIGLAALGWVLWRGERRSLATMLAALGLGTLAAGAVMFLAWPALWAGPLDVLARLRTDVGMELDGHLQFFLGQVTSAPGPAFYPLVLLFRISPLLLLGSLPGLLCLVLPSWRRHTSGYPALLVISLDLVIVMAGLTLSETKMDRYLIPVFPALAFLAASGIWTACRLGAGRCASSRGVQRARRTATPWEGAVVILVIAAQLAVLVPNFPYNLTYFNPLLGGAPRAAQVMMVGNGELLDRAATWIASQPGARQDQVASFYAKAFSPYYERGPVNDILVSIADNTGVQIDEARYAVLYVNQIQRERAPASYFAVQHPLYTVSAGGLDYARVYPGPIVYPEDLDRLAHRTDLDFGGRIRLLGYELETPQAAAGEPVAIALYWQAETAFTSNDDAVYVGLTDLQGNLLARVTNRPVNGYVPLDHWSPGQMIRDVQQIVVPPGTPPGQYHLEIGFYSALQQSLLPVAGQQRGYVRLANVDVVRPIRPPEAAVDLQIARPLSREVSLAPDGPYLLGYNPPSLDTLRPGDPITLTLLWRAGNRPAADVRIYLELASGTQRWRRAQGHVPGGNYPAGRWTAGELVRDVWPALLPAGVPTGNYQASLVARTTQGDVHLLDLGTIDVVARSHTYEMPQPLYTETVDLGTHARLLGYDLPAYGQRGQTLEATFYWQALDTAEVGYTRFVHVLDEAGQIVAQQDIVPGDGAFPTTGWLPGEVLADRAQIALPADLAPGHYRLTLGLYDPLTGRRLASAAGVDAIPLAQSLEVR